MMTLLYNFAKHFINTYEGIIRLVRIQNFPKTNISCPLIRTRACVYKGVKNVCFSENFANVLKC